MDDTPLQRFFDLGELTLSGSEVAIVAAPDELQRLARWLDVVAVKRCEAAVSLSRQSQSRFSYEAELLADIVQNCVVTLEPLESRVERVIGRTLHFTDRLQRSSGVLSISPGEEEGPEEIESLRYDLAVPLLEELSLSIDPYPRKQGAEFALKDQPDAAAESPFAALKGLKIKD